MSNEVWGRITPRRMVWLGLCGLMAACATDTPQSGSSAPLAPLALMNRVTYGASTSTAAELSRLGSAGFLDDQLHPGKMNLPADIASQIDSLTITQTPLDALIADLEQRRKAADATKDDTEKKAAQQAYQQELNRLGKEATTRALLRAVYSHNQLEEQMTWFWMNHFNVNLNKSNIRALVGDYEERAIRPHALGHFRELVSATLHHPAMLRYLDNEQNAVGHINENYARELLELHTMGVNSGYSQKDVQELARVLTGVGINFGPSGPNLKPEQKSFYVREGLFEFNPARHDFGDKVVLGKTIHGAGMKEIEAALDNICRQPATAHFVAKKLALYWVSDTPSDQLVERLAQTYLATDGDIRAMLGKLFQSPEFSASLGDKFKDPMHYVVSAVRLAYDQRPILNAQPMQNWLNRMGEPLYAHETPDGYPMTQVAWASPGQMTTRFEISKAIGSGSAGLFRTDGPQPIEQPAFPQIANALYYASIQATLSQTTRTALDSASSPQEWNTFLLASPEFMKR